MGDKGTEKATPFSFPITIAGPKGQTNSKGSTLMELDDSQSNGKGKVQAPNKTTAGLSTSPKWDEEVLAAARSANDKSRPRAGKKVARSVSAIELNIHPNHVLGANDVLSPSSREQSSSATQVKTGVGKRGKEADSPDSSKAPAKKARPSEVEEEQGPLMLYFHYKQREKHPRIQVEDIAHILVKFRTEIDKLDGAFVVKMGGVRIHKGFAVAECHDQQTLEWITGVVTTMKGGAFEIVNEEDVKFPTFKVGLLIKDRVRPNPSKFFPALSKLNGGLSTSLWRLKSAKQQKNGQLLLVEVDEASFKALQPPMKLYYYTDPIHLTFYSEEEGPFE